MRRIPLILVARIVPMRFARRSSGGASPRTAEDERTFQ
jgi:hypothetical protein